MAKKRDKDNEREQQPAKTVPMRRDPVYGEPCTADVHADEVANWQAHGWEIDDHAA